MEKLKTLKEIFVESNDEDIAEKCPSCGCDKLYQEELYPALSCRNCNWTEYKKDYQCKDILRQEAIKWIKTANIMESSKSTYTEYVEATDCFNNIGLEFQCSEDVLNGYDLCGRGLALVLMQFFNITEDDLK